MYLIIKRIMDAFLSLMAMIILSPLFLIIIIAIKLDSKGPILFKQRRIGKNKSEFVMLKFRTMRADSPKDVPSHLLEKPEYYITGVGRILRKTSLDELPQIWNIFIGNMSIIGPRPALWNQNDLIAERDKNGANKIRPGLTGWAQINGRDELDIIEKAGLDGLYIQNLNFCMDVKCFCLTIVKVLTGKGVVEGGTGKSNHN